MNHTSTERFQFKYIGGVGRVTGSCTLVTRGNAQFLVDCGMVQGEVHAEYENNQPFPFKASEIKFIILTHAHLDHCGRIPMLVEQGFKGRIYCTEATRKLTIEILKDSVKVSGIGNNKLIDQLKFESVDKRDGFKWGRLQPIDTDLMLGLYRSAHILGSASAVIADTNRVDSIWFSGDVGRNSRDEMLQPLLKYRQGPDFRNKLVVCESTYGAKSSPSQCKGFKERQEYFKNVFEDTLDKKHGSVVIPAFSLQRTQDILTDLYLLFQNYPSLCGGISVICDSPLAQRISKIYAEELFGYHKKGDEDNYIYLNPALIQQFPQGAAGGINKLSKLFSEQKTKVGEHTFQWEDPGCTSDKPTVYITSSGMCSAGPVVNHLKRCLPEKKNTIVLTGYQGRGSLGSKLVSLMNNEILEEKPMHESIDFNPSEVRADICMMSDYSGHADREGILDYLFNTKKEFSVPEIHLNHGDDCAREQLRNAIIQRYEELEEKYPGVYVRPNVEMPAPDATYSMGDGRVNPKEMSLNLELELEQKSKEIEDLRMQLATSNQRLADLESAHL